MTDKTQPRRPRLVREKVVADEYGFSQSFLQKDRRGAKRIPFRQIGDLCLYDLDEVAAALEAYRIGGPDGNRRRGPR